MMPGNFPTFSHACIHGFRDSDMDVFGSHYSGYYSFLWVFFPNKIGIIWICFIVLLWDSSDVLHVKHLE